MAGGHIIGPGTGGRINLIATYATFIRELYHICEAPDIGEQME